MVWAILGEDQTNAIQEITASDSDRIVAVVGGAILDHTLRKTLEDRFRNNKDKNNKLFKPNGPLGNLGPKIDLAFQLYVFEKHVRESLYGLAEVRNYFAHHLNASFGSPDKPLSDSLAKLTLHKNRSHYPHPNTRTDSEFEIEPTANNRDVFIVNLKVGLIFLMADRLNHVLFTNSLHNDATPPLL